MFSAKNILAALLCVALTGCGAVGDDLLPSDSDERAAVVFGSVGHLPGQVVADFTLIDTRGTPFTLSEQLTGGATPADAVVLYFTMWCPICLSHSDHILNTVMPQFTGRGDVRYMLVDYVSGSVALSRASEWANGYGGSPFTVLADVDQALLNQFDAAMGSTVVIGPDGSVLMNEDYRTGSNLTLMLEALLP